MNITDYSLATILDFHRELFETIERKYPNASRRTIDLLINRLILQADPAELLEQYSKGGVIRVDLSSCKLAHLKIEFEDAPQASPHIHPLLEQLIASPSTPTKKH